MSHIISDQTVNLLISILFPEHSYLFPPIPVSLSRAAEEGAHALQIVADE